MGQGPKNSGSVGFGWGTQPCPTTYIDSNELSCKLIMHSLYGGNNA